MNTTQLHDPTTTAAPAGRTLRLSLIPAPAAPRDTPMGALLIRWRSVMPGREHEAGGVFAAAVARMRALAAAGRIHSHQQYVAVTGDEGGFLLMSGELDELLTVLGEPETLQLSGQAAAVVAGYHVQVFAGADQEQVIGWTPETREQAAG